MLYLYNGNKSYTVKVWHDLVYPRMLYGLVCKLDTCVAYIYITINQQINRWLVESR